jgi:predicted dehydrogenase
MNRRQFLKRTAVSGATMFAPVIIPARVLGRNGSVAPSDRITLASIGLGGQGTQNMRAFISQPDVQLVALCDVNKGSDDYDMLYQFPGSSQAGLMPALQRAEQFHQEMAKPFKRDDVSLYHDFRELLLRSDIDAVCVCTPDHWHGLVAKAAVETGKDVYCEKPLVNSIPEGRALCQAVQRHNRVLQTGSHERSNDSVRFACELVRNGRIGKLKEIYINMPNNDPQHLAMQAITQPRPPKPVPGGLNYNFWLGPASYTPYMQGRTHFWWRYILEFGGGEMTDRGAHIIDLAQLINDTDHTGPVAIEAKGRQIKNGIYDCFIEYDFHCTYANGVVMYGGSEGKRGLKLVGTDGWIFIYIHGGRLEAEPKSILHEKIGPTEIHVGRSPGHHRDFLNSVRRRSRPIAHEEIGHRTATICHLLNIAMLKGEKLQWDPLAEQVTNDEESNRLAVEKPMRSPWRL